MHFQEASHREIEALAVEKCNICLVSGTNKWLQPFHRTCRATPPQLMLTSFGKTIVQVAASSSQPGAVLPGAGGLQALYCFMELQALFTAL